ncbi:unnamed protein product [Auanema sp. JU1783]|nr:unnamed protein product [Auanema sp. JU1783]
MGAKFRHRVHGKTTKIQGGKACEVIPSRNKHRKQAQSLRSTSFQQSGLIAVDDRPPVLGENISDNFSSMTIEHGNSSKSMISEGGLSKLSEFTSCTNPAFDSVHRIWKSGSSLQTEVISVLAAVAELIKERNGTETDVEYFSALLTALEGVPLEDSGRTAATAYLLHLIVKRVPKEVLQNQFTRTTQIIYTKILENAENVDGAILKNLLSTLGVVFRSQPAVVWNNTNSKNMVVSVASLCNHVKPWVRTMCRRVVRAVLTDPVTSMDNGLHVAAAGVGQFILSQLENSLSTPAGAMNAVRHLCLLEGVMHKMPANLFKQLTETILKAFTLADSMVKCSALQCMHRALQRQPCDAALPTETNVLLINALSQLTPPPTDIAVNAYWMQALAEAHVCLTAKSPERCYNLLPSTFLLIVKMFETSNEQLVQITYQVITRLIERCVQDHEDSARYLLSLLDGALNLRNAPVWKYILRSQMRLYETAGEGIIGIEFTKALESLAALRQSEQCFCKAELEFTIGSAVRHVGAAAVLNVLSLQIDPDATLLSTEFPRSWLIPVLRVNIHNAPLSLFASFFLPLAIKIHRRLSSLDGLPQRLYNTLQMQIWELLPSFCESPSDLEKSFPDLAPVLGAALNERKDLRLIILSAIRRALKFVLQPDASSERVEVLARYAKNFLPLLFNMYINTSIESDYDDQGVRASVLETIKNYSEVAPAELISRFVDSAISKYKESADDPKASLKRSRIFDLMICLVRVAEATAVDKIIEVVLPFFKNPQSYQKKAFRVLEELILRRSSPALSNLFERLENEIDEIMGLPFDVICPSSRPSYMNCCINLIDSCEDYKQLSKFCMGAVDSIIMCLDKLNNTRARSNASTCLQHLCSKLATLSVEAGETPSAALNQVLSRVYELSTCPEGNANVEMTLARSALVGLNIIAQKQIKVLNATHISRLVSHGTSWIVDGRPPVRILAIRLLRILVSKMPEFALQQYRDLLLNAIFVDQLTCDLTIKIRKANRLLLEVLVDKFGGEVLEKFTKKDEWLKQIKNIQKIKRRKAAKASGQQVEPDSDDDGTSAIGSRVSSTRTANADTILELLEDSEDEDDSEKFLETRSRAGSVWLKEDQGGEAVDLLDTEHLLSKATTNDPALQARRNAKMLEKKKETGFKFTKAGKIVILDDEMESESRRKRRSDFDALDADMPAAQGKKRKDDSDAESDYEDSDSDDGKSKKAKSTVSTASSYKPGGKGIHRDLKQKGKKKEKKQGNVQPYAYISLKDKAAKGDIRKILKSKRKSGKGKAKLT